MLSVLKVVRKLAKRIKGDKSVKDKRKSGKSARNGNAPAPYTKYKKRPYQYSHYWDKKLGKFMHRRRDEDHQTSRAA